MTTPPRAPALPAPSRGSSSYTAFQLPTSFHPKSPAGIPLTFSAFSSTA